MNRGRELVGRFETKNATASVDIPKVIVLGSLSGTTGGHGIRDQSLVSRATQV